MHRFFVSPELLAQTNRSSLYRMMLPTAVAHQVRDVLRLAPGERVLLLDNSGDEIEARIVHAGRSGVEVEIVERRKGRSEGCLRLVLYQGLLKSARFEWILEKGTELGVSAFVPLRCQRSQSGQEVLGATKVQRWQRILQEAAEQCGRSRLPELLPVRSLPQALAELPADALIVMPWEQEKKLALRTALRTRRQQIREAVLRGPFTVALFIGPEGGLAPEEVALAREHGALIVSLGPRVLRAETAALVAAASVLYEYEDAEAETDEAVSG
ncbi:16S rRNA (uracil(1498)-N(3))-methyltransferase [Thermogemmatispora carboxidivorans]|uniref:16S rRNA (uracil(1498)-N(3))-methyltransferase n=1 Tax=Thermogemmatispora carboxidivorans TaxID=1382306 RepID=UPI00069A6084|nr:16S rRNA (uracil(1498)-N(3))-methyltransferase [Thermogemmatispora carboxidivorans]